MTAEFVAAHPTDRAMVLPVGAASKSFSPKTLFTIQALRAVAASAVVSYHVVFMLVHNAGYTFSVPNIGASGVDLFFLISGFIMIYTTFGEFEEPNASMSFLRRRAIRILPMYWICTTAIVFLLAFVPQLFSSVEFSWTNTALSYLLLLSKTSNGAIGTVTQTGWTLCFEFYFYLLFSILLNWPRRYFLVAASAIFAAGVILGNLIEQAPAWTTVATDPILFEFLLGSTIGILFIKGFSLPRTVAVAAIAVGILTLAITGSITEGAWIRVLCWGLPCGAILLGAVSLERDGLRVPHFFVALGASSYSLYLVHPFILPAFGKAWMVLHLSNNISPIILGLIAFTCALAVGHAAYLLLEKPVTNWVDTISWRRTVAVLRKRA